MNNDLNIRNANIEDAAALLKIYSYYVENTAISFEYVTPSVDEFRKRMENIISKYPYLVCEINGKIVGYAYAGAYSTRDAYSWTAANSIYVDKDHRRQGIGSALYGALEGKLRDMGIVNVVAGASFCEEEDEYLTNESFKFHTRMGYTKVAHFQGIGKKFNRWYDLLWMQKKL